MYGRVGAWLSESPMATGDPRDPGTMCCIAPGPRGLPVARGSSRAARHWAHMGIGGSMYRARWVLLLVNTHRHDRRCFSFGRQGPSARTPTRFVLLTTYEYPPHHTSRRSFLILFVEPVIMVAGACGCFAFGRCMFISAGAFVVG